MKKFNFKSFALCLLAFCLSFVVLPFGFSSVKADSINKDGVYNVDFEAFDEKGVYSGMKLLGFENGEAKALLEKIGDNYYFTISINTSNADNFALSHEKGKLGETVKVENGVKRHTYSLSKDILKSEFNATMYIIPMDKTSVFKIKILTDTAVFKEDIKDNKTDRPAVFVPDLIVDASSGEMEKGSVYVVPTAKATLCNEEIEVSVKAFYIKDGKKVEEDIFNGNLFLKNVGEYQVVYRVESDKYKTLLGNNTFTEKVVTIKSKIGAGSIVKLEDKNKVLPENSSVQGTYIENGKVFDKVVASMKEIADNFQTFNIVIYSENGEAIKPENDVTLSLRVDDNYSRGNLKVYHLQENGSLKELSYENYGRYIKVATKDTGTFVVCVPGVAFHMPMWGYAVICVASLLVVVTAIVLPIVLVKRKKKKLLSEEK